MKPETSVLVINPDTVLSDNGDVAINCEPFYDMLGSVLFCLEGACPFRKTP